MRSSWMRRGSSAAAAAAAELAKLGGERARARHPGCGTSGRRFFLTARHNALLAAKNELPLFAYAIAGGDAALLLSDELEDDARRRGARALPPGGGRRC